MISKTGLYVIRALSALAKMPEGSWMGTAVLAQEIDAPVNYLGKLFHILAREGLLLSQKGIRGGVKLARPAREISLYEALEPFESFSRWDDCLLGQPDCPNGAPCELNQKWGAVRDGVLDFLRQTTAEDLVTHEERFSRR